MATHLPRRSKAAEDRERLLQAASDVEQLDPSGSSSKATATEQARPLLRKLGDATLTFLLGLEEDRKRLGERTASFDVLGQLLDLPTRLGAVGETELAVRVAEALRFCAPDDMNGQIALVYAQAGERERALELVLTNLEAAREPFISEFRAGDVYRELGEADAAEAYYRRSLELATTKAARSEASLRIASLMIDDDRGTEAVAFLEQQRTLASEDDRRAPLPAVGRNEPCPCGSGKKYKKCHGA